MSRAEADDEGRVILFAEYKDWIDYVRQVYTVPLYGSRVIFIRFTANGT